jgi:hypothetical protein
MHKKLFSSLFHKPKQEKENHALQQLDALKEHTNFFIYTSVDIFHHKRSLHLPVIIYDEYRGLYLFEIKEWSYDDLKDASVERKQKAPQADNTLAYNTMQEFVKQKLDEIIHTSDIPIHNYLITTHLSSHEYQSLDNSLKKALPKDKIIFNDTKSAAIMEKMYKETQSMHSYGSDRKILGALLTQYTLLDKNNELFLANTEQKKFIDTTLNSVTHIQAPPKSGLTSTLLLKTVFTILKDPSLKVVLIKPTRVAKDILHRQLLEIIEHAIVEFNILHVEIFTPDELNGNTARKQLKGADLVICDDAQFMQKAFLKKLEQLCKHKPLVIANQPEKEPTLSFTMHYLTQEQKVVFYETHPHAKALQLTAKLLKQKNVGELIIISNAQTREKLQDDLEFFIEENAKAIQSDLTLAFQELDALKLTTYRDINELQYQDAILLDIQEASPQELEYAINHAKDSVYILYEQESPTILQLKEQYESN